LLRKTSDTVVNDTSLRLAMSASVIFLAGDGVLRLERVGMAILKNIY